MQKQLLFLAATFSLVFAMSSIGQAQSYFMGYETYGPVIWSEQGIIQPTTVMPVGVRVKPKQTSAFTPAPPIAFSETRQATPYVPPAVVTVQTTSPTQQIVPRFQYVSPAITHARPAAMMPQPVCLSGG